MDGGGGKVDKVRMDAEEGVYVGQSSCRLYTRSV